MMKLGECANIVDTIRQIVRKISYKEMEYNSKSFVFK